MESINVYGTNNCPKCKEILALCKTKNYKTNYINVEPGDLHFKKLLQNNVKSFPVVEVNSSYYFSKPVEDLLNIIKKYQ